MIKRRGSIHLFRIAGIDVFLHWYWFLFAAYELSNRVQTYSSPVWNVLEYLSVFFIVLLHEYGHALACRQVGGTANQILLWPLGGVAYVNPPLRPGPTLWSNVAGPLVNLALLCICTPPVIFLDRSLGLARTFPDVHVFLWALVKINVVLLVFNLLPIYPLDGGQVLRSLLWFPLGRARSLMAAVVIGFVGVAGLLALAAWWRSGWIAFLALFIVVSLWDGMRQAQALYRLSELPRHLGFACPSCNTAPPVGKYWKCSRCAKTFDTFQTLGACPHCGVQHSQTMCLDCHIQSPWSEWGVRAPAPVS
jgi:Zn-dependent protease